MTKRLQKILVALAAFAALAVGGSAIASAQQPAQGPAKVTQSATAPEPVGGPDNDSVQSGDQTSPDPAGAAAEAPGEQPGSETAAEAPGEQPGSETAANSDGPGGHADEPGNPTANH
jgi:hypothetical protein